MSGLFKKCYQQNLFTNHTYLIYMYKQDLVLINLQWLICYKTKSNQIELFLFSLYYLFFDFSQLVLTLDQKKRFYGKKFFFLSF